MSLTPASGNGKGLLSVPKLLDDGSNWVLYREKITSIIEGQTGYRKHFRGRAQPPKALSDADAKDDDKVDKYEDSLDEYIQKQQAIRAIILPSIPESLQLRVISEEPVSALWMAVCAEYENQSELVQSDIFGTINDVRCGEEGDPQKTIDLLVKLNNDYSAAGGKLEDHQTVAILLRAMPSKFTS